MEHDGQENDFLRHEVAVKFRVLAQPKRAFRAANRSVAGAHQVTAG